MSVEVFEILSPGLGATLQDHGRRGWRRFGVPPSGPMDEHAAQWANRLLENPLTAPVIELLCQGAKLAVLQNVWLAITGAEAESSVPSWRAIRVCAGELIHFPRLRSGLWMYIGVEGGFKGPKKLGSTSVYKRGCLGRAFTAGDIVERAASGSFQLPLGVAGRLAPWSERRDYGSPPPLRIWPGPQWNSFSEKAREKFFTQGWTVTSQSDRVGYRLAGEPLQVGSTQIISEPVRVGSIQIPENGQPIVTMRDGPTVGGYPKLGMVDPADLSWLAQCAPGQKVRFELIS
jgi:biotin-dependent carboxylase-like uncharacterized protein